MTYKEVIELAEKPNPYEDGDRVRCVCNKNDAPLTEGKEYTIIESVVGGVYVIDDHDLRHGFFWSRFIPIDSRQIVDL